MTGRVRPDEWSADKWTHEALMDLQARMAPGDIKRMAREWKDVLGELDSLFATFLDDVTATIGDSWSGLGAQAALNTMRAYVENSRATLMQANTLSNGLNVLAVATSGLQQHIASSSEVNLSAQDVGRRDEVLRQVRTVYSGPAVLAGNAVATLDVPQERLRFRSVADADMPAAVASSEDMRDTRDTHDEQAERAEEFLSRWGLGGPEPAAPPVNTDVPVPIPLRLVDAPHGTFPNREFGLDSTSRSDDDELGKDFDEDFDEDEVYANQNWMRDPLWNDSATRSAGFDSVTPTSGQAPRSLSPDRLLPPVGAGPAAPIVGGAGPGSTARQGGAMMPMMGTYPAHAGQRRGDENEHYSPPYLVNRDNTRELLGELPKGAVPVIGVWEGDDVDDLSR